MRPGILGAAILSGVLCAASAHASPNPNGLWVSVSAQYRTGTWLNEWSGFIALNIPLDRLSAPRVISAAPQLAEEPPKKESDAAPPAPAAKKKKDPLELRLTPQLGRLAGAALAHPAQHGRKSAPDANTRQSVWLHARGHLRALVRGTLDLAFGSPGILRSRGEPRALTERARCRRTQARGPRA